MMNLQSKAKQFFFSVIDSDLEMHMNYKVSCKSCIIKVDILFTYLLQSLFKDIIMFPIIYHFI